MQYTQAQIDRANAVSLEDFLRTQGETLIKSGREYRWKEHDSLTVRGNKWFRHSQSKGGYPIDFVMEFYGKSFPEAVQLLTGESAEGQSEASTAPPTAFHLPLHNRTADRAIQYLTESRGLNKTLVEAFLLSGDIYEDAKRHNVVFVGRDRSGTPRYAHVRGTADPFRQDIAGSDKSYPFHYEGNGNQLFVFEAPIDLLSFICLYPQDWQTRSYLALGGVSGKALDRFLSERKDTRKVFLCLDSDTAGSEACTRLAQDIPGEIAVIRLVPVRKDWNDVLRQQGDIPSRKFIAETITLRELPTAQPVPMLRMADVELTSVDWLWFPYIPFGKLTIIQGNPGEGKTYFAMRLAAACTNRKPLPGMEVISTEIVEKIKGIEEEDVLVVAGRGVKKQEDLGLLQELADALGGQLATTRPLVEKGWNDVTKQIGLSGRTVKPKLIITCGVSGAVQFAAGMDGAECIVAINTDAEAPIFKIANYCITEDLYRVVPALTAAVRAKQQ